jgi:hypothetical protein
MPDTIISLVVIEPFPCCVKKHIYCKNANSQNKYTRKKVFPHSINPTQLNFNSSLYNSQAHIVSIFVQLSCLLVQQAKKNRRS